MTHLLVVCEDVVGGARAGLGIRCRELAGALAATARVTLLAPPPFDDPLPGVALAPLEADSLAAHAGHADVVLLGGETLWRHPFLAELDAALVVDLLYATHLFENLAQGADEPALAHGRHVVAHLLRCGDLFLCGNERQRHLWLGMLAAFGRLNAATLAGDPSAARLLAVVPFGLPAEPPRWRRPALRGVLPGLGPQDVIALWAGGLWDWLDPLTPIRAVAALVRDEPRLRLVFLGTSHPNPRLPAMAMPRRACRLAEELGLLGQHVFFNEGWVPYERRADYLLEANLGVSAHPAHLETQFALRTRLLDYVWAALPMALSAGDELGDALAADGLAHAAPPGDVAAFADALRAALRDAWPAATRQAAFALWQRRLTWERVAAPLAAFVAVPRRTPDRARGPAPTPLVPVEELRRVAEEAERLRGRLAAVERGRVLRALNWVQRHLHGRRS
ncbi:MAG: glycosyltransferase family 1 protein [Chloroflexi bacterium]|nr:glycosyltransferase family 1 protein [Chloroflexota bacterium]